MTIFLVTFSSFEQNIFVFYFGGHMFKIGLGLTQFDW